MTDIKDCAVKFPEKSGKDLYFYSLEKLAEKYPNVKRLPISIKIVLESVLRASFNGLATEKDVENLANWNAKNPGSFEIPFVVSRIVLQDLTGVKVKYISTSPERDDTIVL